MKQTLHIFAKDTRRFWPEILISVVVTFAFACTFPNEWKIFHDQSLHQRMLQISAAFGWLMVISWWLLIARVVHAETLVGDNQFWSTRPYEWSKLLAAKVLFAAAWIGVPYLLGQCMVLAEGGFHPLSYVPGLLVNLFVMSTVIVLPLFSVSAVTSNFARLMLTLLGCIVLFVSYMFLMNGLRSGYVASNPYTNVFLYPLLLAGCVVAIVLQYSTRRTWVARGVLIVLPLLLAITVSAYRRQSLVDRAYAQPSATATAPVIVSFAPSSRIPYQARSWDGEDYLDLPVRYSGVAEGYAVLAEDFKFTITTAEGTQWTSPWQEMRQRNRPGNNYSRLNLMISPTLYDRFKSAPVTLLITLAVSRYQANVAATTVFPGDSVAVPGDGFCSHDMRNSMICRYALQQPLLIHASTVWTDVPCSDTPTPDGNTAPGESWAEPVSSDIGLTPIWIPRFFFYRDNDDGSGGRNWDICPGSPLVLTQYRLVDRSQTSMTIPNFQLPVNVYPTN